MQMARKSKIFIVFVKVQHADRRRKVGTQMMSTRTERESSLINDADDGEHWNIMVSCHMCNRVNDRTPSLDICSYLNKYSR